MTLQLKKSGQYTYMYAIKSFRKDDGRCTSKVVKSFGAIEKLQETMDEDPMEWARRQVEEMTLAEKETREEINFSLKPSVLISKGSQRCYNGGYLFIQKVYHELGCLVINIAPLKKAGQLIGRLLEYVSREITLKE